MKLKNIIIILSVLIVEFILWPDLKLTQAQTAIVIDHNSVNQFNQIPDRYVLLASRLKSLFIHASIGGQIHYALRCLGGDLPSNPFCQPRSNPKYNYNQWIFISHNNGGCLGKLSDLVAAVQANPNYDVYHQKYCYFEGLDTLNSNCCGSPYNQAITESRFQTFIQTMNELEQRYPDKRFIWWTIPYARNRYDVCANRFNSLLRDYAKSHGKLLFDIADIETYRPDGIRYTYQGYESAYPPYCLEQKTNPNGYSCHPGFAELPEAGPDGGSIRIAKAWWVMMAKIAGWGSGVIPTNPPAATATTFPTATRTPTPSITRTPTPSRTPTPTLSSQITPGNPTATGHPCTLKTQGDANCDGVINSQDYAIFRCEYLNKGQCSSLPSAMTADFNQDGKIDLVDFEAWRKSLG